MRAPRSETARKIYVYVGGGVGGEWKRNLIRRYTPTVRTRDRKRNKWRDLRADTRGGTLVRCTHGPYAYNTVVVGFENNTNRFPAVRISAN